MIFPFLINMLLTLKTRHLLYLCLLITAKIDRPVCKLPWMIGLGSIQWVENWGDESVRRPRLTIDLRVLFTSNLAKVATFRNG